MLLQAKIQREIKVKNSAKNSNQIRKKHEPAEHIYFLCIKKKSINDDNKIVKNNFLIQI